jgi:hypothetical protein
VKPSLALSVLLVSLPSVARADVFAFKDLDGFEKCLQADPVVEKAKVGDKEQTRYLSTNEMQLRCIESAAKVLAPAKSKENDLAFIAAAKRQSFPENALDLISVLVDHTLAGCNELAAYEVLTRSLRYRKDPGRSSPFTKARSIVKRCLKDKQFRTDFVEEKDRPEGFLGANACEILLEEKLVRSCPGEIP